MEKGPAWLLERAAFVPFEVEAGPVLGATTGGYPWLAWSVAPLPPPPGQVFNITTCKEHGAQRVGVWVCVCVGVCGQVRELGL